MIKIRYNYLLFIITIISTISLTSFAQTTKNEKIYGTIKTTDGHPAQFISVGLLNTIWGATTDENGEFEFSAPAGNYTMVIYSINAHKKEFPVTIEANRDNLFSDITILENKNQLEEVIVTGQFEPQSLKNSIFKVRVINTQQIQQRAVTNMQTLLSTEVGIRMSNDMALGETDFELMGMGGNNVKVLIDGIPMIDRMDTKQSLSQIDINTVERVEIIEGPMSVVYGSDALAGVINIITKKGKHGDGNRLSVGARLQEESIGKEYNFLSRKGAHNQSANALYTFNNGLYTGASFTRNHFGGWQGDSIGRKKQWQPKDQYMLGGQLGYSKKHFNIWYRLDYLTENILTEADIDPVTNKTSDKEFIVDRYTHQLQSDYKLNNRISFLATTSYQDYNRRTRTTIIDLTNNKKELSLADGAQDKTNYSTWFARFSSLWKASHNLNIQPGIEYQFDEGAGDRIVGTRNMSNTALFLSAEYTPVGWLNIRPGVRSNFNSAYDAPLAVPALNVKAALSHDIDLRMSYGRGFRAPTLQELYYSFHDSNHHIDGNPDLKAEHSDSYMASLVWRPLHDSKVRLTSSLSGFYNNFRNRIDMLEDADKAGYYIYWNIEKFKTTGFIIENNLVINSLTANLSFSYLGRYNSYTEAAAKAGLDSDKFTYSPEIAANIIYDWQKVAIFSFFYKFNGKRKTYRISSDQIAIYEQDSYNWGEFAVTKQINKYLNINAGVRNIFNITTVRNTLSEGAHSGGTGVSQIGSGRSYLVGLTFNFQK